MKNLTLAILVNLGLILFCVSLRAQTRTIQARRVVTPVSVDGRLNETEWPRGFFQSGFVQMEPSKGDPSREETRVAVQYDAHNLYVAFICEKSYTNAFVARETRRDQLMKADDLVALCLDTYHDERTSYLFFVNGLDTQIDARASDDGKYTDIEWDAGWRARSTMSGSFWYVEFEIPFATIRFRPRSRIWGINFGRYIPQHLETSYWSGLMDYDFRVSQFGNLTGLEFPRPSSELRFIPYATVRYERFSDAKWNLCNGSDAGLDVEFRYRNNVTGNLTFNPDFATVEGDRERINMTRWELSFPEKRKFFLEGSELFRNRIQGFYSRRIGEIDYGGKVIGKTGPLTYAVIGLAARGVQDNPLTETDEAFPRYSTGIVRLKQDVMKSSTIGLLFIDKEWSGGSNRVLSLDGVFHFPRNWHFTTQFVLGMPGSFKYNYGGFVRLARENNILHYHLRYTELGEQFKESVNGVGFIRDDDRRELDSAVNYKWWIKRAGIEYIDYASNYNIFWGRSNGILRSWEIVQRFTMYFSNKFGIRLSGVRDFQRFEKGFHNHSIEFILGYNTEEWSISQIGIQGGRNFDREFWMAMVSTRLKVREQLSVEFECRRLRFTPDPDGESTWLSIAIFNYQFTPDLFIRLFTQYRSAFDRFYVYGLFGWRFHLPNSAVYVVYTRDDFDNSGLERSQNEVLFLKFAYDFSL